MEIAKHIAKAKQNDQNSFTHLLDLYWNEVYYFILRRTENEADAEDITIQTFAKAFDQIQNYRDEYQFNTWLIAIAKNVHVDLLRKQRAAKNFETQTPDDGWDIIDSDPTAEDRLIIEQNLKHLLQCIKQLKPHYQEVIQLRYFQELSYQDIADQLGEPLTNVKVKLLRARKLLAEILQHSNRKQS